MSDTRPVYRTPLTAASLSRDPPMPPTRWRLRDLCVSIKWDDFDDHEKVLAALELARLRASPAWLAGVVSSVEELDALEASIEAIPLWQRPSLETVVDLLVNATRGLGEKIGARP